MATQTTPETSAKAKPLVNITEMDHIVLRVKTWRPLSGSTPRCLAFNQSG